MTGPGGTPPTAVGADGTAHRGNGGTDAGQPPPDRWHELRSLLLTPERERIREVERRLAAPSLNVDEVSRVLPEAVARRSRSDPDLGIALGPVVGEAIRTSVRRDPKPLVDAVFPIIGPAIRRSIASAFSELIQSLNATLEHSLTPRGLAWRFEAWRTGRSFGEVVLAHSLVYRVEQLFVIHRESGLLIEHVTSPGVQALSPDMVAGMLTAITDFVRDSFDPAHERGLDALTFGELTVWVEQGPRATVAAVIRGHAPPRYRAALQEGVEELHRVHVEDLDRSAATGTGFDVRPDVLEPCLASQLKREARRGAWRLALLAGLAVLAFTWYVVPGAVYRSRFGSYLAALHREPGIVVGSTERDGRRFLVTGLRDPLARDPAALLAGHSLDTARVAMHWEPYVALRPEFILRRARSALLPPDGVRFDVRGDTLFVSGVASAAWRERAGQVARALAGVGAWDDSALRDSVDLALERRAIAIGDLAVAFDPGSSVPARSQQAVLDSLAGALRSLVEEGARHGRTVRAAVVGSTDTVGTAEANAPLRLARARAIRERLSAAGVPARYLTSATDSGSRSRRAHVIVSIRPDSTAQRR